MDQIKVCSEYIEKTFPNWKKLSTISYKVPFSYNDKDEIDKSRILCIVKEKQKEDRQLLFDKDFHLILNQEEKALAADYYAFCFGGQFYYIQDKDLENPKIHILRYLGVVSPEYSNSMYVALGNHTTYSLLDGCQKIELWIEKAKYLGMKALGLSERNSLRSILNFQTNCKKQGIKPILGEDLKIEIGINKFWVKFYIKNEQGYRNLVLLSNALNVSAKSEGKDYIVFDEIKDFLDGLVVILPNGFPLNEVDDSFFKDNDVYYQVDTREFLDLDIYYEYLNNIKKYIKNYSDKVEPVLCEDAFYLEEEDKYLRKIEHEIASEKISEAATKSLHFKNVWESIEIFSKFWKNKEDKFDEFFTKCIENTVKIADKCNFELKFQKLHIPIARINIEDWEECLKREQELNPSKIF